MNQILIIDDDVKQLSYLEKKLSDAFLVNTQSCPLIALECCREKIFDAIIVDLHMPISMELTLLISIEK